MMNKINDEHGLYAVRRHIEKATVENIHQHEKGQLVYVKKGVFIGKTERNQWLIQEGMLVWLPPYLPHYAECRDSADIIALYIPFDTAKSWSKELLLVDASFLAIGIIEKIVGSQMASVKLDTLLLYLKEELIEARSSKNILPLPTDRRLMSITRTLIQQPSNKTSLREWGESVGASERTLSRLFIKETGLTYKGWIKRLKYNKAITGLRENLTNEELSTRLGFSSGDSFSHWFRKEFNISPRNMKKQLNKGG